MHNRRYRYEVYNNECKILIFSVKNLGLVYYKSGINIGLVYYKYWGLYPLTQHLIGDWRW